MNTDRFKKLLLAKRREIQSTLGTLERESSAPSEDEVKDYADAATGSQGASESLEIATMLSRTLEEVQDALRRIEDGSYGKCTKCGRQIEPARLEAVPWAAYCLQDQEKQDSEIPVSSTL